LLQIQNDFVILHQNQDVTRDPFWLEKYSPCEPPSDENKSGEIQRALSERVARVAQRPIWPRSAGEVGEPGSPSFWLLFLGEARKSNQPPVCHRQILVFPSPLPSPARGEDLTKRNSAKGQRGGAAVGSSAVFGDSWIALLLLFIEMEPMQNTVGERRYQYGRHSNES